MTTPHNGGKGPVLPLDPLNLNFTKILAHGGNTDTLHVPSQPDAEGDADPALPLDLLSLNFTKILAHRGNTDMLPAAPQPDAQGDAGIQAVTASFTPGSGLLSVFGDSGGNTIEFSRDAAGNILVNDGAVLIVGGTPTVANTSRLQAFGRGGDDVISLDETNGGVPSATLYGGAGHDALSGGSGGDLLFGQADNDTLLGMGGFDMLFGGAGNDVLAGGDDDDQMFGAAGDDRMIWNEGDGTDLMEGGSGVDTAEVNGGDGSETFTVTANGTRVRFDRLDSAPSSLDLGTTEKLVLNAGDGDDMFSATGNVGALIQLSIDAGAGNDTILGGNGADQLLGGDGDDFVDGNQGNDVALLGDGHDLFQWDPGDGSDTIEGEVGFDTLRFNGSSGNERIELSANGERLRMTRDLGNIVMDANGVERVEIQALGGTDTITVNDLSGTDVTEVAIDLAGTLGGSSGDGQPDTVLVRGTDGADAVEVQGNGASAAVLGLSTSVELSNAEAIDRLAIETGTGNDTIDATSVTAMIVKLDGGAGNDTILGGNGADELLGGDDDDIVEGNQGNDLALLGAGDDVFRWDAGDGNDTVEGQDGIDTLLLNGSESSEIVEISANGERVLLFRDVDGAVLDTNDMEIVEFTARGGADTIAVLDLTGTDVHDVRIDLGEIPGQTGDGQADEVNVWGTEGDDTIAIENTTGAIVVAGLAAEVVVHGADADGIDRLEVNGRAGNDVIDASGLVGGAVDLALFGDLGADVIIGSEGDDFIFGSDGDDVAFMGAGDDTFEWNPGDDDDTLEGQAGFDTLRFNGAEASEQIDIAANGGRVRFFRDVASVTMDMDDVERIEFDARGGADNIVVNDLSGTDVVEVVVDLATSGGLGDGQADTVTIHATDDEDVALLFSDASGIQVVGLAAQVTVTGTEVANDTVTVMGHGGDDIIDASGVQAGAVKLVLDGGAGNDVIIGSAGNDVLIGGEGDDVLIGGDGTDILDPGTGEDVVIQGFVPGAGTEDQIDLSGRGFNFEWLMAHASEVDGNVVLDLGDQGITLQGVRLSALHQDDFLI